MLKRVHLSNVKFEFENKYQKVEMKPKGLWYGINNSWIQWLEDNMPEWIPKKPIYYDIKIDESKILFIETQKDVYNFSEEYGDPSEELRYGTFKSTTFINWPLVAERYSGIEVTEYYWNECRFDNIWYNYWDCESGCIWKKNGILEIKEVKGYTTQVQ